MMMVRLLEKFTKDQRGSAAIEFAFAVTGFVAVISVLVGTGVLFSIQGDLRKSMIAAERYALIHNETDEQLKTIMRSNLSTYNSQNLALTLTRATNGGITYVKVDSTYTVDLIVRSFTFSNSRIFPT